MILVWYLVAFASGMAVGALIAVLFMWKNVRMYRILWENEKNGNFLMVKRLVALEEERMDLEGDD